MNSKQKDAVLLLEQWWRFKYIELRLIRIPGVKASFKYFLRRMFFKLFRVKAKKAAKFVLKFLRDSAGSTMVKKLYAYRTKASKIQKWFRSWLHIQETRTHVLWMAMEKIGKERRIQSLREATKAERASVAAMANTEGFKTTIARMNKVGKNLGEFLTEQENKSSKIQRKLEIEETEVPLEARRSSIIRVPQNLNVTELKESMSDEQKKRLDSENRTKLMLKFQKAMIIDEEKYGKKKAQPRGEIQNYPTMAQRYKTWYWKAMRGQATKRRFKILRNLLSEIRKRHILANPYRSNKMATHVPTGSKQRVSMAALKNFLHSDTASEEREYDFYESDDEGNAADLEEREKKKAQHNRPPFLLLTKGALAYFYEVPLSFFSKSNNY